MVYYLFKRKQNHKANNHDNQAKITQ